jgi:acetyl-CoA synthetase
MPCPLTHQPHATPHDGSVVFAGFSAEAVRDRVNDAVSKWVVTADEGKRGGKTIPLKQIVDKALEQ